MAVTALSSSDWRRPVINTRAPSSAKRLAIPRPIPALPPVTSATLSASFCAIVKSPSVSLMQSLHFAVFLPFGSGYRTNIAPHRAPQGSLVSLSERYASFRRGMEMDRLAAMEAFVRVIDAGSVSGAAKQLRVGQPAVSKTISQLEDRLAVRLQLRSALSLMPTEAGRNFYERAKRSIEEAEEAELAARGVAATLSGRLRISAAG